MLSTNMGNATVQAVGQKVQDVVHAVGSGICSTASAFIPPSIPGAITAVASNLSFKLAFKFLGSMGSNGAPALATRAVASVSYVGWIAAGVDVFCRVMG